MLLMLIALPFLFLFLILYRVNRTQAACGLFFLLALLFFSGGFLFFLLESNNQLVFFLAAIILLFFSFLFLFGVFILIALLFLNARLVFRREKHSLQNSLTLVLGIALTLWLAASFLLPSFNPPLWVWNIWTSFFVVLLYELFCILVFLTNCFLSCHYPIAKKQNYIIVLGSGLVNGKVPPLLQSRIDIALGFYKKQSKKRTPPTLLFSGGQGKDEPCSEAAAMRSYALKQGLPFEDSLVEELSTSTKENFRFSKQVMDEKANGSPYRCIFATNNYHVYRAALSAHREGLKLDGLGGKTALYYLPNALLREYIAYFHLHRRARVLLLFFLFLFAFLCLWILDYLLFAGELPPIFMSLLRR